MARLGLRQPSSKLLTIFVAVSLLVGAGLFTYLTAYGVNRLGNRQVKLSSSVVSATSNYSFAFSGITASTVGSIGFEFCSNSPLIVDPCDAPTGFDASAATLLSQSGETGFVIDSANSNANTIVLTRTASMVTATDVAYEFGNIQNSSQIGTSYIRIKTYATEDATGTETDFGGLAYALTDNVNVNATVPPYLLFCVGVTISGTDCATASGNYVNFGELSNTTPRTGSTQMVVATNAANGYTTSISGTTMLSGTNSISALASNDVSRPGTGQFGINLRHNANPDVGADPSGPGSGTVTANYDIPDRFRFVSGEQLAGSPNPEDYRKYTVSYLVNVPKGQAPGIYVSTLTYVSVASF